MVECDFRNVESTEAIIPFLGDFFYLIFTR